MALQVIEQIRHTPLHQTEIETVMLRWIETRKDHFALCVSSEALSRLCESSSVCLTADTIFDPPQDIPPNFEDLLAEAAHIGDDVLRYIIAEPQKFNFLREGLTAQTIKAFFRVMWDRSPVPLTVAQRVSVQSKLRIINLEGPKMELGLIQLTSSDECDERPSLSASSPLLIIRPSEATQSFRVRYPQLVRAVIHQLADFVIENRLVEEKHLKLLQSDDVKQNVRCIDGERNVQQNNKLCFFPFEYEGELHFDCLRSDNVHSSGWCATQFNWVDSEAWGYCHPNGYHCLAQATTSNATILSLVEMHIQQISSAVLFQTMAQFQTESAVTDGRQYPRVSVTLSSACCPAMAHHIVEDHIEFQPKAFPRPRPIPFVCSAQSVTVELTSAQPLSHYAVDSAMPSQIKAIIGTTEMRPILFTDTSIERLMPIDGRQPEYVVAVPGASVGQFAIGLVALGAVADTMDQTEVTSALVRWVNSMSSSMFVYATDTNSLIATFASVTQPNTRRALDMLRAMGEEQRNEYLLKVVLDPPEEMKPQLLAALTVPVLFGDPFLRFVCLSDKKVDDPSLDSFLKRLQRVVPMVIEALFTILWAKVPEQDQMNMENFHLTNAKNRLDLAVLRGPHQEKAFVKIVQQSEKCQQNMAPLFPPLAQISGQTVSVWVYHEDASRAYQKSLAQFLTSSFGVTSVSAAEVFGRISDTNFAVVEHFIRSRQDQYPYYRLIFHPDCCPQETQK